MGSTREQSIGKSSTNFQEISHCQYMKGKLFLAVRKWRGLIACTWKSKMVKKEREEKTEL